MNGVGIERDDDCCAVVLGGMLLGGANDLLMSAVNPIKNTYGESEGAGKGGKGFDGAENLHAWDA